MKKLSGAIAAILFLFLTTTAQKPIDKPNIIIITTDGFRWQEVFKGADSSFLRNINLVKDTGLATAQFWDRDLNLRRQKLMPFFWNVIAKDGQLYGNRDVKNKVNITNLYKISYQGYNEILTGHNTLWFNPNLPVVNKNSNILEFLQKQDAYQGKVVAFSSWNIFPSILNEKRSNFPVNSGYEMLDETDAPANLMINKVQQNVVEKSNTRYDLLTFASAREYIEHKHPKVALIGFGETDHYAHQDQYDIYLQKANQVDRFIAELWYFIQTDPFYKDKTALIITTDHGRGRNAGTWHGHGLFTAGSSETWLAMLGPGILPKGEMKSEQQLYQKQIAQTVAAIAGLEFKSKHPIGKSIDLPTEFKAELKVTPTDETLPIYSIQE